MKASGRECLKDTEERGDEGFQVWEREREWPCRERKFSQGDGHAQSRGEAPKSAQTCLQKKFSGTSLKEKKADSRIALRMNTAKKKNLGPKIFRGEQL